MTALVASQAQIRDLAGSGEGVVLSFVGERRVVAILATHLFVGLLWGLLAVSALGLLLFAFEVEFEPCGFRSVGLNSPVVFGVSGRVHFLCCVVFANAQLGFSLCCAGLLGGLLWPVVDVVFAFVFEVLGSGRAGALVFFPVLVVLAVEFCVTHHLL